MSASQSRKVLCVSTTKPTTSLTPGGGGGSLTLICPRTGSIQSSLRPSGQQLGVASVSLFPTSFANNTTSSSNSSLAMAFGSTDKKNDTYAMLVSVPSASLPPILHWKCRLPEPQLTGGLLVSSCGNYIVGGGETGTIYIWKALGGLFIRSVKAHYRSVSVLAWSPCGRQLMTGGADGMVHAFSLLDLVQYDSRSNTIQPLRTWSHHHLPVTALVRLTGGRMATTSEDGQVVVIQVSSSDTLATLQMPHPIRAMTASNHRLFCGDCNGSIYIVDLDEYAIQQTRQVGATIAQRRRPLETAGSAAQQVFGDRDQHSSETQPTHPVKLLGHNKAITAMSVFQDGPNEWLVSGDQAGQVRVWDLACRACVHVICPWSHTSTSNTTSTTANHPVTSICVLDQDDGDTTNTSMIGGTSTVGGRDKNVSSIVQLVTPLQKFAQTSEQAGRVVVPLVSPKRDAASLSFWDVSSSNFSYEAALCKRRRLRKQTQTTKQSAEEPSGKVDTTETQQQQEQQQDEMERLRAELDEAKSTIERWESVNNKLMAKLQQQ